MAFKNSFALSYERGKVIPPKFVVWDCSRKCNLNCEHCGAKKEIYEKELTTEQIKGLVKKLSDYKVKNFVVTGGEPLIRRDLFEVFSFAKKLGLATGISTNGFLINEDNSKIISNIFDAVQISLDGPEMVHNKIRGNNNSFQKATKAVKLLQKNNCRQITICSVITPSNIRYLEELKNIVKKLRVDIWKITTVMPIGKVGQSDSLYLSQQDFVELLHFVKNNKKELNIEFGENVGYLGKYDEKVRQEAFLCPVGFLACCIGVDGNVRGCPEQPDTPYFTEGNILETDFSKIWKDGFKKYRDKAFLQNETCRKCKSKDSCLGGCWVMKLKDINCPVREYKL